MTLAATRDVLNITDAIFEPWNRPDAKTRPAIYYRDSVWSYHQLITEINRMGNGLLQLGVGREDRVLLIGYDSPFLVSALYGAMKIGAVPIPVNTNLPPEDYLYFLEDSHATVLMVEPEIWEDLAPVLAHRMLDLQWVIILPGLEMAAVRASGYPGPFLFYQDWIKTMATDLTTVPTLADEMAFWLYTSGSTGRPKAAVHCHKDMLFCNRVYAQDVLGIREQDRLYSASKLYFAYGLGNGSYFAFANGASVVLVPEKVEAQAVIDGIIRTEPTVFFGVPTLYNAMLRVKGNYQFPTIRECVSAGEPLPAEIYTRWKDRFGLEIIDGIGSTEVLHIYISNRPGHSRPGVTGRIVQGYEAKVVDENGHSVAPGIIGDLMVKGDSIAAFYWNQAAKTRASMIGEWFRTGDKFAMDDEGYLYYAGRSDDMIKAGGIWVSPIEVEGALLIHPAVAEAAVVGALDMQGLEKPVAFVILLPEVTSSDALKDELRQIVRSHLAHFKSPREIYFVTELPKTANGKIQRYRLRLDLVSLNASPAK